jgi:hypothetical protein
MKLSFIGLCVASAAAILLQDGATSSISRALAAEEGCIKTDVALHVRRCPVVVVEASASPDTAVATSEVEIVDPTVTPAAAPPEGCIKTEVALHIRRCPPGV